MNTTLSKAQMKQMMVAFTAHHEDGVKDNIGPNKPDAPFFNRLAGMDEIPMYLWEEAAERLHKYKNTQVPYMMQVAGIKGDITAFLDTMDALGKKGKAIQEAWSHLTVTCNEQFPFKDFASKGTSPPSKDKVFLALKELMDTYADEFGADFSEDMMDKFNWLYDSRCKSLEGLVKFKTVKAEMYEDVWYGRNDINRRWPKKSQRISLRFANDSVLRNALKSAIGFPDLKWTGKFWSLAPKPDAVNKAVALFQQQDYITTEIEGINLPEPTVKKQVQNVSATVEGETIVLQWPWLQDDSLRSQVMSIVKGVMGRKWDAKRKAWLVPVAQGPFLKGRLESVYKPLADAINSLPELTEVISKTAERISISSAAELNDESAVADMRARLAEVFPEGRELYPFQYVGVRFTELAGGRALIGDDMGVGKTIQALAYAALHPEQHPVLVVCPANVKFNWLKEARAWLPTYESAVIRKGSDPVPDADIVVINYDLMHKQQARLEERGFNIVICDESHYLKNNKAKRTQATLAVAGASKSVLCLSGTAITNRPNEFFTTLNLLRPVEFPSFMAYAKQYCDAYHNGWGWDFSGASNIKELHERTRSVAIRRLKKEVMAELPDKIRQLVDVVPNNSDMRQYRKTHQSWVNEYQALKSNGALPAGFVLNMLTELRHEAGRLKAKDAATWAINYYDSTEKPIIVFTHHRDVQDAVVQEYSKQGGKKYGIIHGGVSAENRQRLVNNFQDGQLSALFCSTVAAKEGLTLTAADTVLFVEREWVPGWEEQAEDRVNRIGQDAETVHALYLTVKGTIDEKFNAVVEEKRKVVAAVLDGGEVGKRDGIAKALLKAMVDAGDLPADMLKDLGVSA